MHLLKGLSFIMLSGQLMACNENQPSQPDDPLINKTSAQAQPQTELEYKELEWTDLMPKDDLDALMNPPAYLSEIEDGSEADQIDGSLNNNSASESDDRYQQALTSTRVIEKMDGQAIRLPGFVVPLAYNEQQMVTQFLLVPFFGACIHVPPPPPNQVIFVEYAKGLTISNFYDPIWVSGVLSTKLVQSDMGTSAYQLQLDSYQRYDEQ